MAVFIALIRRRPAWDQDHVDADEEIPTVYFDPDDPEIGNILINDILYH